VGGVVGDEGVSDRRWYGGLDEKWVGERVGVERMGNRGEGMRKMAIVDGWRLSASSQSISCPAAVAR
jgi:hypothetical protein